MDDCRTVCWPKQMVRPLLAAASVMVGCGGTGFTVTVFAVEFTEAQTVPF